MHVCVHTQGCNMCYILTVVYSKLIVNIGNKTLADFTGLLTTDLESLSLFKVSVYLSFL